MPLELARRLCARDRSAVAEALNLSDDQRPEQKARALRLLEALERDAPSPGSPRIGITGAPGAGKSTLLDAVVRALRRRGETVAVVAVDPSSQRTRGALLGDRIRMRSGGADPGVFIRSLAARDRLGGVAESAWAAVAILATAFDRVFLETVGVGQSEGEVAALVDTLLFVASPASGDTLQFMKAGILELPDVFVVNKADAGPGAERTARELEGGLRLAERDASGWMPPVLLASARDGVGIEAVIGALEEHHRHAAKSSALRERRARGRERFVLDALTRRYGSFGLERLGGPDGALRRLRDAPEQSAFGAALQLGREIESALEKAP